jgi:two-component system nitrogen regulation response regulator NtrX
MGKILLVDDDPATLKVFQILLSIEGHDVRITESGEDAIEIVTQGNIDLLISDVCMSPTDGFEVLRRVREVQANMPVIMLSGFNAEDRTEMASQCGAFEFIAKPPNMKQLIKSVNEALAGCGEQDDSVG